MSRAGAKLSASDIDTRLQVLDKGGIAGTGVIDFATSSARDQVFSSGGVLSTASGVTVHAGPSGRGGSGRGWLRGLVVESEVDEDPTNDERVLDEGDDALLAPTVRTAQDVDTEAALHELGPGAAALYAWRTRSR